MKIEQIDYYWMINTVSYSVDGTEVLKGEMVKMNKGNRAIINEDWRPATKEEIRTKRWHKGKYFNLRYV